MSFPDDCIEFQSIPSAADVRIITSSGSSIPAHSGILASASPVLDKILDRPQMRRNSSEKLVPILGVPCEAVVAFVRYLYSSRCVGEELERYGLHLLVLSHVYLLPELKRACGRTLAAQLTPENVVDVLQMARQCDASSLYVKCLNLVAREFGAVEKTEGWKFVQDHDPWLELELLKFLEEAESRQKRRMRNRRDQILYLQLSDAMECLQHIFTEGCTNVCPSDKEPHAHWKKAPCKKFSTCSGLQLLLRHFAMCKKRVRGGCPHCKRMWQLLRLHSSTCDQPDPCKVPLCRQFKLRMQLQGKREDGMWRLLVRKVVSAKAISTLSKRKREETGNAWDGMGCDVM